jgi:hypothetical protein
VQAPDTQEQLGGAQPLVGEDAAAFDWGQQSLRSWGIFGVLLTGVLGALYAVRNHGHAGNCWRVHDTPLGRIAFGM